MKVFIVGTSLLPSYGGPALSVSRLAVALAGTGAEIGLWAPDGSAGATPLISPESPVRRLSGSEVDALADFSQIDVLHDNGIWLGHNHRFASLAFRHGIPRVVSTRGMLEPWAMNHKRWKKRIAWSLYQKRDLQSARYHHATAEKEAQNVRRLDLGVPICMIPNGVDVPDTDVALAFSKDAAARNHKQKTALFLGRIYPVKGLPMLVEAWARVRPVGWVLRIAGPDEAGHRAEVERAISLVGLADVISLTGPLDSRAKQSAFFNADLFVLPTLSESFSMVIAEALAHGLPVLTTTGAPWPMLPDRGCGWRVDATVVGIAEGLRQATGCDSSTLKEMGRKGREFVAAEFAWGTVARQFLSIYESVVTA